MGRRGGFRAVHRPPGPYGIPRVIDATCQWGEAAEKAALAALTAAREKQQTFKKAGKTGCRLRVKPKAYAKIRDAFIGQLVLASHTDGGISTRSIDTATDYGKKSVRLVDDAEYRDDDYHEWAGHAEFDDEQNTVVVEMHYPLGAAGSEWVLREPGDVPGDVPDEEAEAGGGASA